MCARAVCAPQHEGSPELLSTPLRRSSQNASYPKLGEQGAGMHRTLSCAILYLWERAPTKGEGHDRSGRGGISRAEFERRLINRSLQEEDFRQQLLSEPNAILEQDLGRRLPESIEVRVVQESQDTIYLVLPSRKAAVAQGSELSDQDLENVSGGSTYGPEIPSYPSGSEIAWC